jgi:hypothetical protein
MGLTYKVSRRYNDFELLHKALTKRYKTLLIPAMPAGTGIGMLKSRNDEEVIEERRL